jgi:phytoene dehydrogenase-like protein
MADYDAIVVGAGHNGLAAASVLANRGLSVLCVEKTNWPGGMAATKELFKGYKHSVGAWALLVFRREMINLLGLERYGLELITPRSSYTVFGAPEDAPFIGFSDTAEMAEHVMKEHGMDAIQGLAQLGEYLKPYKDLLDQEYDKTNPRPIEQLIADTPDAEIRERLIRLCYSASAIEVMRQFFPDREKHRCIQGSLMASAIDGTHMGPYSPGSALSLAYHYTAGDAYDFKIPRGGIGALSNAIERSFRDAGGEIQYKAQVKRFLIEDGPEGKTITGVELKSGETITAKVVLSSLDAHATFLNLAGEENLPNEFVYAVKEIQYTNGYIQLHMTLSELPEFTGHLAFANKDKIGWLMSYIPSAEHLQWNWEQYQRNEVPDEPVSYCYFPSVMDPSLAPEGRYTCTIFSHYFPADPPPGKHNAFRDLMADRAIDAIAKYAPNLRGAIIDKVVLTQEYFQKTFGVTAGDFSSGLLHASQMWDKRPVSGWSSGYRTPVQNLIMCGAATHPGPGVTCRPGYNAAQEVLRTWEG